MDSSPIVAPETDIQQSILQVRGIKVMLDFQLAGLYGVETKSLKRAVRRNAERFPPDFMFELSKDEYDSVRYQFGTLKRGEHSKFLPFAFTEQGVAMLSSVLHSKRAVLVNIAIMRVFAKLRDSIIIQKELALKLKELGLAVGKHDVHIRNIFRALERLMSPSQPPKRRIGY
ncbi:MAG: hypothetical protein A2X67_06675 [Ignavibacteria bacterium GWA2_55_11]|nr:MAG: hypothetical protein A2X67_06675 [Ignavibacteria bacterium GWA2_55_11]